MEFANSWAASLNISYSSPQYDDLVHSCSPRAKKSCSCVKVALEKHQGGEVVGKWRNVPSNSAIDIRLNKKGTAACHFQ